MNNLNFDKEAIKAASEYYNKRMSQDASGLFLGGSDVSDTSDMNDPINEVNNDPRFRIRVVM